MPSAAPCRFPLLAAACAVLNACTASHQSAPSAMLPPRYTAEPERGLPVIAAWCSCGMSIDRGAFQEAIEREMTGLARPRRFDGPPCPRSKLNGCFRVFIWSDGTIAYDDTRDIPWECFRTAHVPAAEVDRVMQELRAAGLFDFPPRDDISSPIPDGSVSAVAACTREQTGVAFMGGDYASEWEETRYVQITMGALLIVNRLVESATADEKTIPSDTFPAMFELPGALRRDKRPDR